jgi:DNA ligase (NAD+)
MGPKIIDQLVQQGLVQHAIDLFELRQGDVIPLERFADKSADNLVDAIKKSKRVRLANFLYALGIRHVGEETARDLAERFSAQASGWEAIEKLQNATAEELEQIQDVGTVVAKSIANWFGAKSNQQFLEQLKEAEIHIETQEARKGTGKLEGQIFVLTGSLSAMSRDEAKKNIRRHGGIVSESVSSKTTYVIAGENPGSKLSDAKNLKIPILSEKEFLKLQ